MTKRRIIPALLTAAALGLGATAAWAEQPANADMQKQLARRLDAFFDRYADPKYDLKHGGKSKTRLLTQEGG